jgi:hypothetical protein|tara:strand:+ start:883 stop:1053 length:171 start_codon:yes stop_codon:yes gene_type:complete
MGSFITWIKNLFTATDWEEDYLSRSVDHYDLERRQRAISNGTVKVGPYGKQQRFYY